MNGITATKVMTIKLRELTALKIPYSATCKNRPNISCEAYCATLAEFAIIKIQKLDLTKLNVIDMSHYILL